MSDWRSKLGKALMTIVAVTIGARVVSDLLGRLLPTLIVLLILGGVLLALSRGPHARH